MAMHIYVHVSIVVTGLIVTGRIRIFLMTRSVKKGLGWDLRLQRFQLLLQLKKSPPSSLFIS